MAAKPVPLTLAAVSLAFGLALPAQAQVVIDGSVQVNLQALDQLGAPRGSAAAAPLLGATGARGAAPTARRPLLAQPEGPRPLVGETRSAPPKARAAAATRQSPKTASKSTASVAAAPSATAPAAAPSVTAPASAPSPAPEASAPAMPQATPGTPMPVMPAPQASAPAPVTPAAPALTPTPAPQASVPAVDPAPVTTAPSPAAPTPAPAPAPQAVAPTPAPTTSAPAPVPAPSAPAAAPPQVAAAPVAPRPAPAPSVQGGMVTIPFSAGQGDLPAGDLAVLDALAQQHVNGEDRLQIRAYAASSASDGGSGARRLSLTRALAVRQYLIDRGIRSTRIDVRALGAPTEGAADRVEVSSVGR